MNILVYWKKEHLNHFFFFASIQEDMKEEVTVEHLTPPPPPTHQHFLDTDENKLEGLAYNKGLEMVWEVYQGLGNNQHILADSKSKLLISKKAYLALWTKKILKCGL